MKSLSVAARAALCQCVDDTQDLTQQFSLPDIGLRMLAEHDLAFLRSVIALSVDGIFCQSAWQGPEVIRELLLPDRRLAAYERALALKIERGPQAGERYFRRILLFARHRGDGLLAGHTYHGAFPLLALWNKYTCQVTKMLQEDRPTPALRVWDGCR